MVYQNFVCQHLKFKRHGEREKGREKREDIGRWAKWEDNLLIIYYKLLKLWEKDKSWETIRQGGFYKEWNAKENWERGWDNGKKERKIFSEINNIE